MDTEKRLELHVGSLLLASLLRGAACWGVEPGPIPHTSPKGDAPLDGQLGPLWCEYPFQLP